MKTFLPSYWGFPNTSIFHVALDLALWTSPRGHEGRDWVTNRLQPCLQWAGKAVPVPEPLQGQVWQPCPAWRGADPGTDPVSLPSATSPVLPCRLPGACQETAEPSENSSTSQWGRLPCPDGHLGHTGTPALQVLLHPAALPAPVPWLSQQQGMEELQGSMPWWKSVLSSLTAICWESLPVWFLLILPILILPLKLQSSKLCDLVLSKTVNPRIHGQV